MTLKILKEVDSCRPSVRSTYINNNAYILLFASKQCNPMWAEIYNMKVCAGAVLGSVIQVFTAYYIILISALGFVVFLR